MDIPVSYFSFDVSWGKNAGHLFLRKNCEELQNPDLEQQQHFYVAHF